MRVVDCQGFGEGSDPVDQHAGPFEVLDSVEVIFGEAVVGVDPWFAPGPIRFGFGDRFLLKAT